MHVLIATAGALDPEAVVDFARCMVGADGSATVATVVRVPRSFLAELGHEEGWNPLVDQPDLRCAEAAVAEYVEERGRRIVAPVVAALRRAGIVPEVRFLEGDDPVPVLSALAAELGADAFVVGATRPIFASEAWESVSARLMVEAGIPVLAVPPVPEPEPVR